jgi:molybdopterin molybdotransferase
MLSYQEAVEVVVRTVRPLPAEEVGLPEALGRVLAEPVLAGWDLPPADNAAMDGYAFAFAGQQGGAVLAVAGFVPAGQPFEEEVAPGEAVKIMTGAPLPAGCDTVVPIEEVEERDGRIRLARAPRAGQHRRRRGEELCRGEPLLPVGTPIHSGELGLLAAAGIHRLKVHQRPRVALLSTGDELVELGEVPGPGRIVNSNFHLLAARLREEGCEVVPLGIARDRVEELASCIERGLSADLLLSTGGVSVGDRDHVQEALRRFGFELGFWKVAIKPGKPVLFGTAQGTPVFGLPGNPAAAAATFELFVRPALRRLAGHRDLLPPGLRVSLAAEVAGGEKRQRFIWGTLQERQGRYLFTPSSRQGSGQNRSIQGSQALLPVAGGSPPLAAGAEAEVLLLRLPPGPA